MKQGIKLYKMEFNLFQTTTFSMYTHAKSREQALTFGIHRLLKQDCIQRLGWNYYQLFNYLNEKPRYSIVRA